MTPPRILYCHCQYAQVLPSEVKEGVLKKLCESGVAFEAVADLCELSARKDPLLKEISSGGALKIAACYPRAVRWLFSAGGVALDPSTTEICNLRTESIETAMESLLRPELQPNLPTSAKAAPSTLS